MKRYYRPQFDISIGSRWTKLVKILIIINISVFIIQLLFSAVCSQWVTFSSSQSPDVISFTRLWYEPAPDPFTKLFWLYRPDAFGRLWLWQLITYMFLHSLADPWHLIFNMLALWMFGSDVERAMGSRKFLTMYLTAGLFAGICSCLFVPRSPILGASGAIFAIEVAFAMYFPNATIVFFIFPMKAKHLVMIFASITIFNCIMPSGGNMAHFAHLGGLLYGFLFVRYEPRLMNFIAIYQLRQQEKEIRKEEATRKKVDELLEKVSREGLHKLTRKERFFLNSASKEFRKRKGNPKT